MRADNMTHTTPVAPDPPTQWRPRDLVYSQSGNVAHVVAGPDTAHGYPWTRCGRRVHTPPWQGEDAFARHLADTGKVCRICQPPEDT